MDLTPDTPLSGFVLHTAHRGISMYDVLAMTECEAVRLFASGRWGSQELQLCPTCGTADTHDWSEATLRWTCRNENCSKAFSVLAGTTLQGVQLPATKLLALLLDVANSKETVAAPELARRHELEPRRAADLLATVRVALRHTIRADVPLADRSRERDDLEWEQAWRESVRRQPALDRLLDLVHRVCASPSHAPPL